jgi:protein arginine N-methyltransferase 5
VHAHSRSSGSSFVQHEELTIDILSTIGINPATHSSGMFSWFPIFFPIKTPLYVPAGAQVILDFWRLTDRRKVWYEWRVSCKVEGLGEVQWSALHNVGGRSSSIGLY